MNVRAIESLPNQITLNHNDEVRIAAQGGRPLHPRRYLVDIELGILAQ